MGGWGARLFFGNVALENVGESIGDEFEQGKAMLSGRGLVTRTGEAGALTVIGCSDFFLLFLNLLKRPLFSFSF